MARLTNAQIVERLSGDNRTVVAFPDQTDPTKKVVATDVGPVGASYGLTNVKSATVPAYRAGVAPGGVTDQIAVAAGGGPTQEVLSKKFLRTQYFHIAGSYDATKVGFGAKRCYVNLQGQPLDDKGEPTTVAEAVDAETTELTGQLLGKPVTNYAQTYAGDDRTPLPGTWEAPDVRQTALYAPYPGYTAQHDLP
jgi:hypothetical protein